MLISIIIPSYKPQEYIYTCLDSICNQTFDTALFEVIVVLNGCNEPFYSELKSKINTINSNINISIHQTDVPGVSNARNIGITKSIGEYIVFVDDDDYISPSYLDELFSLANKNRLTLSNIDAFNDIINSPAHFFLSKVFNNRPSKPNIINSRSYFSVPVAKMIHKDMIGDDRFDVNLKNGEDAVFMFLVSKRVKEIMYTSADAVYHVRIRQNSATSRQRKFSEYLEDYLLQTKSFFFIWIKSPMEYNFIFFISRILSGIKTVISRINK